MKLKFALLSVALILGACVSKQQIADSLKDNPEILAEAIKKNPSQFMAALREAAEADQRHSMERAINDRADQIDKDIKNPKQPAIDESRIIYGDKNAPITIVKYADFQCPACAMGYQSLEEVKKTYPGKIRFIHKNIPLPMHAQAREAAEIFEAMVILDKAKALKFYKKAYETQREWRSSEALWKVAGSVGISKAKVAAEVKKGEIKKRIQADLAEHEKFGFAGTPAYMVNGVALYGAPAPEDLIQLIDRLQKK